MPKAKRVPTRIFVVKSCYSCPNIKKRATPGAGYAEDYFCGVTGTKIAGYVEWSSDIPEGVFPADCPLKKGLTVAKR